MRKFFTRLLMIVFLVSVFYHGYASSPPVPATVQEIWPEDESTTQAQPGTNVLVLQLTKDLNAVQPFGPDGVIALSRETEFGYQQVESILYKVGGANKVVQTGPATVELRFAHQFIEDATYHVTIENDAIRFADGSWFAGLVFHDWRFTVDDIHNPLMVDCDDPNNVNGQFGVSIDQQPITVCFSEPVFVAPGADFFKPGNVAFYTAAKAGLDPNDEFGGDALYAAPWNVKLWNDGVCIYDGTLMPDNQMKSADITTYAFDRLDIFPLGLYSIEPASQLKYGAIGPHVWPADRDIYLRLSGDLLVDKAGNPFEGIDGSPFDPYSLSTTQYWFSTRAQDVILASASAIEEEDGDPRGNNLLWEDDDILVTIFNERLALINGGADVAAGNVSQFLVLSIGSTNIPYTVESIIKVAGYTQIILEPGMLPENSTLKVDLIGDVIHDKGDLRVVGADSWTFNTGDFSFPVTVGSINNELCTNFDLRINSNEPGIVYYAIVKEPVDDLWGERAVTDTAIVTGEHRAFWDEQDPDDDTDGIWVWKYFNNVDDGAYGQDPNIFVADFFNINESLTAFEHIDDFTGLNHGDQYTIYYFVIDPTAEGPYNNPPDTPEGRVSPVYSLPVQLTDCLDPEITWFYQDINDLATPDDDWDLCITALNPKIKKNGKFKLDFPATASKVEGLYLQDPTTDWEDVITLEVREAPFTGANPWTVVEATITTVEDGGEVIALIVTPKNSYPSGGRVRVTLESGSVMDAAGNVINEDLVCRKNVEIYADPWVDKFTVEYVTRQFPANTTCPDTDTEAAKKNGKITIEFNNPIFTPKRDEQVLNTLEPLSNDPLAWNYVGKYIKLREGDGNGAEVTDDIATHIPLTFELTREENGGVTKIVATPGAEYLSETWYYVELEVELQDENRRELQFTDEYGVWDNNLFVDLHEQYCPYPTGPFVGNPPYTVIGNSANYFMRFKSEDTVAPELRFVFEKIVANWPETPNLEDRIWPYIAELDEDMIDCINPFGQGTWITVPDENGVPIGAIITEWSEMGFDNKDYYVNTDPNGLRPYFKLKDAVGNELKFDVVLLNIYDPLVTDTSAYTPYGKYFTDAVWFGFVPFEPLEEGSFYTMEFDPVYQAPGSPLRPGSVFVDDNGNAVVADTFVGFQACGEEDECIGTEVTVPVTTIDKKSVAGSLTPSFTVKFDIIVDDEELANIAIGGPFFTLSGGGKTWNAYNSTLFIFNDAAKTVSAPFDVFLQPSSYYGYTPPAMQLDEKVEYTLTVNAGHFLDRNNELLENCKDDVKFWSPDLTPPAVSFKSPDINADTPNNLGDDELAINPRKPGELRIKWNEKVTPQNGKVIQVWENGTSKRLEFTYPQAGMTFVTSGGDANMLKITLPADVLYFNSHFHVDVQAGFVKDVAGNESDHLTGPLDGPDTWTFATRADKAPEIVGWSPICVVTPGTSGTTLVDPDHVQVGTISVTLDEKVTPVAGKKLYIEEANGSATLYQIDVTLLTSSNGGLTWSDTDPDLVLDNNQEFNIYVEEGAFKQTFQNPAAPVLATPDYEGASFLWLNCASSGYSSVIPASFAFGDASHPTADIWPVEGNIKVPFNAHGYVRFSEPLIARVGFITPQKPNPPKLILEQGNIKNWIKVLKYPTAAGTGTPVEMAAEDYVCEFVNPERTHVRVTFLDELAPSIGGVTANMQDEWRYQIRVNTFAVVDTKLYGLQDIVGNYLFMPETGPYSSQDPYLSNYPGNEENALYNKKASFWTEDITPPNFYVTTCDMEGEKVEIKFTRWETTDPYVPVNDRDYPAEDGTIYYVVRPTGTVVTANDLFNKVWADVKEVTVDGATETVTWTLPAEIEDDPGVDAYNYTVYAVMKDNETDVFASYSNPAFGDAWPSKDDVFKESGDANPATGCIGFADIRPAPNKNMEVKHWDFCFCDDDEPEVVSKEWHEVEDVLVDATFEITFDELIQAGDEVELGGEGTGGVILTPKYGYEVRLREWNNNVAVPITLMGNGEGTYGEEGADGFIITPVDPLDEETRYYIEIDRWVVWDVPGSNCNDELFDNPDLPQSFPQYDCTLCNLEDPFQNNFAGWIGRTEWWFQTQDNTPPELVKVEPQGNCVPEDNNKIIFTFKEKNGMQIQTIPMDEGGLQGNSIYVYKVGSQIPYEVIPASSGDIVKTATDKITITYTTTHPYNSEEEYFVEWRKDLFTDNATPEPHNYWEALAEVTDGEGPEIPSLWHQFGFQAEDTKKPVASWSLINRMWVYAELGPTEDPVLDPETGLDAYVYPLATGVFDPNDPLSASVDVCAMWPDGVPSQVGFYVWFDEEVQMGKLGNTVPNDFYLTMNGTSKTLSLKGYGVGESGGTTLPGGIVVPEGKPWFSLAHSGDLASLEEFNFGIVADSITDVSAEDCRTNTLGAIQLLNFCVWDASPATARLFDGTYDAAGSEIFDEDECVAEREFVYLKFDKEVVKTVNVVVPPQFGNPVGPPWWTYSNLYLTEADLMDTDGQIFEFYTMVGEEKVYVQIDHVDIVVPGKEFKLWLKNPLNSEWEYTFEIYPDVLKDIVRVPNGNFFPGERWDFTVTDWEAPYITSLTPPDYFAGQSVSPMAPLVIEFNEEVMLGTDARIIIRDNGIPQGVIYNYKASDPQVVLSNDFYSVTINHGGLDKNTMYYVQIEPGFVKDRSCSNYPFEGTFEQGLIDDDWNFKTGDLDGPQALLWPTPGDDCVPIDENLIITFDENIILQEGGQAVIYKVREDGTWHSTLFGDVVAIIPFYTWMGLNYPQISISGSDAANGLTDNVLTIIPPEGLWESKATYYVRIVGNGVTVDSEADVVLDVNDNSWMYPVPHGFMTLLPGIHHNQWYFTIGNNDEPVLVSMTPERLEVLPAGVAGVTTDLTMTFEEPVAFGEGVISIFEFIVAPEGGVANQEAVLWKEFTVPDDVDAGKITLSDDLKTVTIHGVELLDGIDWYYVLVGPGVITNNVECTLRNWSGISNPDFWKFTTDPDVTDPEMTASAITSDACSEQYLEPATVAFELTFSEGVSVATAVSGVVEITKDGEVVASMTIAPEMIDGNVITFGIDDFDNPLEDQTEYELVIGGDDIHDLATASLSPTQAPFGLVPVGNQNWFAGAVLPFETGDFTAPTAIAFEPNAIVDLENMVQMVVTFDEPVQDGAGLLNLINAATDEVMTFDAAADEDLVPETVTFTVELADETAWYVLIDEGFVTDMVYMDPENCDGVRNNNAVTDEAAWTFAIDDNTKPEIIADLTEDVDNLMLTFDIVLQYNDVITAVDVTKAQLMDGTAPVDYITGAVIGVDPTQVIVSVTVPAGMDQKDYMLDLADGFVLDDAINPNASDADQTGPYHVGDRTAPILDSWDPKTILASYHTPPVVVEVDFFDDSDLTVVLPITIENSLGEVVETWTPVLDGDQAASFMPELWFDTYHVIIPAGAVVDVNGNEFAGFDWYFSIVDDTPPNCLLSTVPADGDRCIERDVDLVMTFCERMAPGAVGQMLKVYEILEVQGELPTNELHAAIQITEDMIAHEVVTVPVTGLKDETSYIVMIDFDALRDEAGNSYEGIDDPVTWNFTTGDNTPPTVTLVPVGSGNNVNEFIVNAVFSEAVTDPVNDIIVMINGEVVAMPVTPVDELVYAIAVTAEDHDTVTITVPAVITDVPDGPAAGCEGNPLAEEVTEVYIVGDNTAPTVEITAGPADWTNTPNDFMVELTFSEEVTGVEAALAGSTGLVDWDSDDNIVYTLYFEGLDETELNLLLDAALVTDVSENLNPLAEGLDEIFTTGDHVAPTAMVVPASGVDLRVDVLEVTVTFDEDVIVPDGGIVVTDGEGVVTPEGGNVYTVAITAEDGATAKLWLTELITDDSKNGNPLVPVDFSYEFGDRTAPEVFVYKPGTVNDTINVFDVIITFSEDVEGVDLTSVTLTGHRPEIRQLRTVVEGKAYEATLSGADGDTLTLGFSAAIMDLAGNPLVPTFFTYTIADNVAPTVVVTPATGTNLENHNVVLLTFSEDVLNVLTDVTVTGAAEFEVTMVKDSVYQVEYTADDLAEVVITLPATITDWKGNALMAQSFTYAIGDHVAPTAAVVPDMVTNAPNVWDVVITFTEPVVLNGGITVTGGTAVIAPPVGNVYTVNITAEDLATVTLSLSNAITDASENENPLANPGDYTYVVGDNTAPTVTAVGPAEADNTENEFDVVLTFSEEVTGVAAALAGSTGMVDAVTEDGIVWTVSFAGVDGAALKLLLDKELVADLSPNANMLAEGLDLDFTVGDHVHPVATVEPVEAENAVNTWVVKITFSEPVNIPAGSVTVAGATDVDEVVDGLVHTLTITAEDMATVTLTLTDAITDKSLNANALANPGTYTYEVGDNTAPEVTVVGPAEADNTANTFTVKLVFTEKVTGVDLALAGTTGLVGVGSLDGGLTYNVIMGGIDESVLHLMLNKDLVTDLSENANKLVEGLDLTYTVGDHVAPTATVIPDEEENGKNTFTVNVIFSEAVIVPDGGITVTNADAVITPDGNIYTVVITGEDGAEVGLHLNATITDDSKNENPLAAATYTYTIGDNTQPTVTAAGPEEPNNTENEFDVVLTFSEPVAGVEAALIGSIGMVAVEPNEDHSVWTVSFNGVDGAALSLKLDAAKVADKSLNANKLVEGLNLAFTVGDHVAPTAVVVPAGVAANAPNEWDVVITFSEPVTVPEGAISVTGGTATIASAGNVYTVSITAEDLATVVLALSGDIEDKSLNTNNLEAASYTYVVGDWTAPTATVVPAGVAANAPNEWDVVITFSEPVTVPEGAITVTGGTAVITNVDHVYTVAITAEDLATVTLALSDAIADLSPNANKLVAVSYTYVVGDWTAPTATVVPATAAAAPNTWDVVITFSEPVTVPEGAISVTNGTIVVGAPVGNVYTATITAEDHAVVTLSLSGDIEDKSANTNNLVPVSFTYTVGDNTKPVVTVNPASGTNMNNTFNVILTFSEKVAGVNTTNVTVTGTGASMTLATVLEGMAYQATITGADQTTVTLALSDAIVDLAGNKLDASSYQYTIGDHVAPTLVSAVPPTSTGNLKNNFTVVLTFSEPVTGVAEALTVVNGTVVTTGSGTTWNAAVTAADLATVTMNISNAVADLAGNKFAGVTLTYIVGDNTAPKLTNWTPNKVITEDSHPTFVMELDENVVAGAGNLYVYQQGVAGAFVTVPITSAMISGKKVTVVYDHKVHGALDKNTKYYVLLDGGALTDASGNKVAAVSDPEAWTFTTGNKFPVGIEELNSVEFKVYPNPFNNELFIQNHDKLTRVTITNIAGQKVMDVQYPERVIRTDNLVSGVYIATLFNSDGIIKSERIGKR